MTASNPVDQPFRRLFAGFDRDVEPPADLATRLRLRVLAEAELDDPVARRPVPAPSQAPAGASITPYRPAPIPLSPAPDPARPISVVPRPASRPDEVGARRRRQPWYLVAAEVAAVVLLLMGAAVVVIQRTVDSDRSAPRLGSSITAVAEPSADPQLLWERTDPDLQGTGDIAAGDDLLVRTVYDEHKGGFLWWETYEYENYIQALDRRTGELRWQIPVDAYGTTYVTPGAVLYVSYPNEESETTSLIAFSTADGSQLWRTDLLAPPAFSPDLSVRDNLVFLATYDATVRAYDLTTGAGVWATSVGAPPAEDTTRYVSAGGLTLDGDRLLTLDPTGAVVELDAATGAVVATRPAAIALPLVVYEGRLIVTVDRLVTIVTGTDEGQTEVNQPPRGFANISAMDRVSGETAWSTEVSGDTSSISQVGGRLLLWSVDGVDQTSAGLLRVLDLGTGAELWIGPAPIGYPIISPDEATTSDGQLLIGNQTGDVIAIDLATGAELWRYKVGEFMMTAPFVTGGLAIVADAPGHLVAIAIPENGG